MPTTHPPLRAGAIVRRGLATYRAQFPRVAGAALIVLVPLGLLDTLAQRRLEEVRDDLPDAAIVSLLLFATITTIGAALGSTFSAGLLDKLVGEHQHGHARLSLGRVLATLP